MARFVMASTYAYSKFAVTRAVAGSQYSMLMPYAKEEDGEARTEGNKVATVKGDKWLVKKVEAKKLVTAESLRMALVELVRSTFSSLRLWMQSLALTSILLRNLQTWLMVVFPLEQRVSS